MHEALMPSYGFDSQKRLYFFRLGLQVRGALKMHKSAGLWEKNSQHERSFGRVSEHCLAEVARVSTLADLLSLQDDLRKDLMTAAAIHDFYKRREIEYVTANGFGWEAYHHASEQSTRLMQNAGIPARVISLANSVGHEAIIPLDGMLIQKSLSDEEWASLAMHYVDTITQESFWFEPAELDPAGEWINAFDRRMKYTETFPKYHQLNEDGRKYFGGQTMVQALRRNGKMIEDRLTERINDITGSNLESFNLPIFIDNEIKKEILQTQLQ